MEETSATINVVRCKNSEIRCLNLMTKTLAYEGDCTGESVSNGEQLEVHFGCVSLKGRRPEMEDTVVTLPNFMAGAHFFGVYDGHGSSQVADYCRNRLHLALLEELKKATATDSKASGCMDPSSWESQQVWEEASTNCFNKVDSEVGAFGGVEMETIGSTAVIAIVSSSYIVVANCGDSRAVLSRGRKSIPLSMDHKPDRAEEAARIEAAGGKVIHWDRARVCGVLAMSRAIGDAYLKPWITPVPEVTLTKRSHGDECLILASDGLWDVITNDEACEIARRCLRQCRRRNPSSRRGEGLQVPAARVAAQYLSTLALHRGSRDNISVIVLDLKANSSQPPCM